MGGDIIRESELANQRQWARIRGWKIKILEVLEHSGGMTVAEIAEQLNHRRKDIREYCRRLIQEDGAIDFAEKWGYKINTQGLFILSIQPSNTNTTLTPQKHHTNTTIRQLTLAPYSNPEYSDVELAITNLLISHYIATKEMFVFLEDDIDLCERLEYPPDIVKIALRKLRQDGVCYMWWDKVYLKYQLRLKKTFLERIKHV